MSLAELPFEDKTYKSVSGDTSAGKYKQAGGPAAQRIPSQHSEPSQVV